IRDFHVTGVQTCSSDLLSGLFFSCLIIPFGKILKTKWSIILPFVPLLLFVYFIAQIPLISSGNALLQHIPWVTSLGINFDFKLDGLSLLFALLITGIGTAIFT